MSTDEASRGVVAGVVEGVEMAASDDDHGASRLPQGYVQERNRICIEGEDGQRTRLCGPIWVRLRANTTDGTAWYVVVQFQSADGLWREAVLPREDLVLSPPRVARALLGKGFEIWGAPRALCQLLLAMEPGDARQAVTHTGWVGRDFSCHVTPDGQVLTSSTSGEIEPLPVFVAEARCPVEACGTLESWKDGVIGSEPDRATLIGACAAIAPIMMACTGHPSFLLHVTGNDDAATLCRAVAASVWGAPGALETSWQRPVRELVAAVDGAGDGLVILWGYQARHASRLAAVIEALAARDARRGEGGRVLVLSLGPDPLVQDPSGRKALDLQDTLELDARAWQVSDVHAVLDATSRSFGTAGPAAVQAFMRFHAEKGLGARDFLEMRCDDILDALLPSRVSPEKEAKRASQILGALHGAGKLAVNRGVFPRDLDVKGIFSDVAMEWRSETAGLLSADDHLRLTELADAVRNLSLGELVSLDQAGAIPGDGPGWQDAHYLYLTTAALADIAATRDDTTDRLVSLLMSQGVLLPGRERGNQYRMPSKVARRPRAYRISKDLLRFASIPELIDADEMREARQAEDPDPMPTSTR